MSDVYYSGEAFTFVWDPEKEAVNFRKHGITFRAASRVFDDELRLELPDLRHSETEDRYITIGLCIKY